MKTKLTGSDLLFIFNDLKHALRIANSSQEYRDECLRIMNLISELFSKIKVEIKE